MSDTATVVLVHGAWHGAWCWTPVVDRLAGAGIPVVALDLPGHGDDPRPLTDLHGHGDAVRAALDAVDGPVVLVGHSFGGAAITDAGAHAAVRHLVYLTAFCLDAHESVLASDIEGITDSDLVAAVQVGDDGTATLDLDLATPAFYADCDPASIPDILARLVPERLDGFGQLPRSVAWREKPSTYVVCTEDRAVTPAVQRALAARCDDVVELASSHSPFLSHPDELAELLAGLAGHGPEAT